MEIAQHSGGKSKRKSDHNKQILRDQDCQKWREIKSKHLFCRLFRVENITKES